MNSQLTVKKTDNIEEVILIEDFDPNMDSEFLNDVAKPYFRTIFVDLALRRLSKKSLRNKIDKVAFFEYVQLPGIINDRFFSQFSRTSAEHIREEPFIDGMLKVYLSTFEEKLQMSFKMYDLDGDGQLQPGDVRLILSYVPFKTDDEQEKVSKNEGLYASTAQSYNERKKNQDEIDALVDTIFDARETINYDEYRYVNMNLSSEMFTAIMRVLHEMLPCSANFYSMK